MASSKKRHNESRDDLLNVTGGLPVYIVWLSGVGNMVVCHVWTMEKRKVISIQQRTTMRVGGGRSWLEWGITPRNLMGTYTATHCYANPGYLWLTWDVFLHEGPFQIIPTGPPTLCLVLCFSAPWQVHGNLACVRNWHTASCNVALMKLLK